MEDYISVQNAKHKLFSETLELAKEIYKDNCVGGLLHIVLYDGNLDNSSIECCINCINKDDGENKELYLKCANNLLKMTPTQRLKLYRSI